MRNKNSWDCSKRDFYNKLKDRKDEVQQTLEEASKKGYVDFDAWYTQEYEWRFLRDILGGQDKMDIAPFDYCNLIHLPVMVWKDAQGKEHRVTFMGEKSPADYGFGITEIAEGNGIKVDKTQDPDGHLQFTITNDTELGTGEAPIGAEAASFIKYGGKVYTFGAAAGTDVTKGWVTNNFQYKVYYGAEPSSPRDGDIWTTEGEETYDYEKLINKPKLNGTELIGNKSLSDIGTYGIYDAAHTDTTTYNAQEIDNKIAESAAIFRGTYVGGATRPASFDYDTYCKTQMTTEGITPTNADYLFVWWTDIEEFDRCRYTESTDSWSFEYTVSQIGQKQSDWTETDTTAVTYIQHKPTIPPEQIQSDWNQTDESALDYIKNKPTIPTEKHLYKHVVYFNIENVARFSVVFYNSSNTQLTKTNVKSYESQLNCSSICCWGLITTHNEVKDTSDNKWYKIQNINFPSYSSSILSVYYWKENGISNYVPSFIDIQLENITTITDNVTQIF